PATSPSTPSHDQRFFLKTQRRREVRALLAHLPRYVQHLQRHPHSLLARLLGTTGRDQGLRGGEGVGKEGRRSEGDRERAGEGAREWGGGQDGGRRGSERGVWAGGSGCGQRSGGVGGACPRSPRRRKAVSGGRGRALGRGLRSGRGWGSPGPGQRLWVGSRLRTAPLRGCLEGAVGTATQAEEEGWGRGLEGRARGAAGLEQAGPGAGLGRDGPGAVELGAPHLAPSPLPGVHSLRVARGKKEFFIIMLSVFYPAGRISERYDIKGCEVSRWVEPAPEGSPLVLVLKDLNFQGKTIDLGPQRSWLIHQMELDTAFLRELNVLDYSLLMAFQRLHEDERGPGSSLIFRTARSVRGAQSPEEPGAQNRRLLPDSPNALHILDGPEQRYFLGLVDLATVYGLRKRLEHLWKTLRYPGRTFSTVSPARYARRLCQWVEAHTE
uniref:Phosphatidylinositol-4-phosphate 5-kinase like 1 n=2 Tax=Canis lupus dingo TaxID=286419 RepID=A0A8C0KQB6_CANLU